jgi:hypothetical protein
MERETVPFYAVTSQTNWFTPLKEWVTHEAWVQETGEMTMINDKLGVMLVRKDGSADWCGRATTGTPLRVRTGRSSFSTTRRAAFGLLKQPRGTRDCLRLASGPRSECTRTPLLIGRAAISNSTPAAPTKPLP